MSPLQPSLPDGWHRTGQGDPKRYRVGEDPARQGVLTIESLDVLGDLSGAFGALARTIAAAGFHGRKVELDAELMGEACDQAAIWMRVDSAVAGKWLRFDNLIDRPNPAALSGSFNWTARTIVLDVPEAAVQIVYGILLVGAGTLLARDIRVSFAPPGTPRTDTTRRPSGFGDGVPA